jgi:hypothetical protein
MKALADRIGVFHGGSKYYLTEKDHMTEGADALQELGTRVIKIWGSPKSYVYNSSWPQMNTLVEFLQAPYCRRLFERTFTTFVIEALPLGYDNIYDAHDSKFFIRETQQQLHDAAAWLLKTYEGTGKTFILQNWEGDWAMGAQMLELCFGLDPIMDPTPEAIERMIDLANARQAGVSRAREEVKAQDVFVYQAIEANLVKRAMEGHPSMANDVFPHTRCDLYSYSAWDTPGDKDLFRQAVLHLKEKAPASETFGSDNVFIGEFGWPENRLTAPELCQKYGWPRDGGGETQCAVIRNVVDVALEFNLPYVLYWGTYCVRLSDEVVNKVDRRTANNNADCRGYWLIRPDGSKTQTWKYMHELFTKESG